MPVVRHFLALFRMRIPKYRYGWVLTRSDDFGFLHVYWVAVAVSLQ